MFLRYFFWNFVGKKSDMQDAGASWWGDSKEVEQLNYKSGFAHLFPVRFYALPLLFGLLGLIFHFYRDPKMAFTFFIMFLVMGALAAIAQNQQDPQPRERDYFYAGAFMVFAMWISLGVYSIIDWLAKKNLSSTPIIGGVILASIVLVPINLGVGGWPIHTRAGNYIPFDYSYNILQSTEKDAILFTNGDNDTFPLWFLQDVIGIRRDVRIVNLSLANTLWYVDQAKNREPWGALKVPLPFSDDSLHVDDEQDPKALSVDVSEIMKVSIKVPENIMRQYTNDPAILSDCMMNFDFIGSPYGQRDGKKFYLYQIRDKVILEILKQTKFTRPVYYSATVGPDVYCGLDKYFRMEGMAWRICPVQQNDGRNRQDVVDPKVMEASLMNIDNSNNFSTEPKYGFKLRNLANNGVYYDEVHRRLMNSYRNLYISYARYALDVMRNPQKATAILDTMNKYISIIQFPLTYDGEYRLSELYKNAGSMTQAKQFAEAGIKSCLDMVKNPDIEPEMKQIEITGRYIGPYRIAAYLYKTLGDYNAARDMLQKLYVECEKALHSLRGKGANRDEAQRIFQNEFDLLANIDEYKVSELEEKGNIQAAIDTARTLMANYNKSGNQMDSALAKYLEHRIGDLQDKMNPGRKKLADTSQEMDGMQ